MSTTGPPTLEIARGTDSRRKPRLLVVGPLPPQIGGVETMTQTILESRAFDDFELAHCDISKGRPKSTQGQFDAANAAWALRHFARMTRAVDRFRPDIVYVPVSGTWSGVLRDLTLGWLARRHGARVIAHQHAGGIHRVLAVDGLPRRIVRAGFDQFDRLLVLGERWRSLFVEYGVRAPVEVVPSTFRREVFERGGACLRPTDHAAPFHGLFVGQFGRGKGTLDLLEALHRCRAGGTDLRLVIVGPPQQPHDEREAHELRRERGLDEVVEFTGPLLGEALYDRFCHADLLLLPSYNEGLPVVLYEAGAFGVAVITTPVGAVTDLITDEQNGLLVAPGDVDGLAAALTRLASHPDERRRLGGQLRSDVAAYHPDRVCERIAAQVRATLAGPVRAP